MLDLFFIVKFHPQMKFKKFKKLNACRGFQHKEQVEQKKNIFIQNCNQVQWILEALVGSISINMVPQSCVN